MNKNSSDNIKIPAEEDRLWELYHENSKQSPWYRINYSNEEQEQKLKNVHLSLPTQSGFKKKLNAQISSLQMSLGEAFQERKSCREMFPGQIGIETLSSLIHAGFGITRPDETPRPLRSVPSGGKLFPLELYFYAANCEELEAGLYHYDVEKDEVQLLKKGRHETILAKSIVQSNFANDASLFVFLTGVFERTLSKYGERGYRLVLLEAGHAAQNINLAATALNIGCLNLCAFYDRKIEEYLEIDGVNHSILYVLALGKDKKLLNS